MQCGVRFWSKRHVLPSGHFTLSQEPGIYFILVQLHLKKKSTYFGMRRNRQQKGFSVFDCRLFSLACTSFCRFGRRCRKLIVSVSFCLLCKRKSTRILGHLYAGRRFVLPRILLLRKTLSRKLLVNNIIFTLHKKIASFYRHILFVYYNNMALLYCPKLNVFLSNLLHL